jgi:ketosteroid isomerase-like protein
MTEEKRKNMVRGFLAAFEKRDMEKALGHLTDDATWVTPRRCNLGHTGSAIRGKG